MTYKEIVKNEEVNELLKKGNENLGILGFTDHSQIHCAMVARRAGYILKKFGYDAHDVEIVKIAGYMHDIGNAINRSHHAEYGSILAYDILKNTDLSLKDQVAIASAIGHHDESTGGATDPISAALIIADKTDVRRDRVREKPKASFDKHDRVNYAVTESKLKINTEKNVIPPRLTDILSSPFLPPLIFKHPLINYLSLSALASIEANLYMNLTLPVCPSAIAEYV